MQNGTIHGTYVFAALVDARSLGRRSAFPQNPSGNPSLTAAAWILFRLADAVMGRQVMRLGALLWLFFKSPHIQTNCKE